MYDEMYMGTISNKQNSYSHSEGLEPRQTTRHTVLKLKL